MIEDQSCDVLVIGAGPAGSTAARVAAGSGAQVLLLERKAQVGVPVQCAGYVAKAIRWHLDLADECIVQSVDRLRTSFPDGTVQEVEAPGYILDRTALDRHLAVSAIKSGVQLLLKTTAVERYGDGVVIQREGQRFSIRARVLIGADGPQSLVARWMGFPRQHLAHALQHEVVLRRRLATAQVYFRTAFRGGYGWLFPRKDTALVGAAFVSRGLEPIAGLERLVRELEDGGVIAGSALSFSSGLVPVGGPIGLRRNNAVLVGDAAGHAHPITGAGIVNAIIAGEMAGRAAARAVLTGDLELLREYEDEWSEVMGGAFERAVESRSLVEATWDSSPEELSRVIRRSWIAADE